VKLSRGAQRCLKLLRWYAAHFQEVYPKRSKLAAHLDCSPRQLDRYISELKKAGLVNVFQAGPQPSTYQVFAAKNGEATAKQWRGYGEASGRGPYRVAGTAEEIWRKRPMETETPSPEVLELFAWADAEGYPTGNGAELEAAERAYKLRKPPAKETGYDRAAKSAR